MNEFKLNNQQIQVALNNLVKEKMGINTLMELTLNAFMKSERDQFLPDSINNKANGFRRINGLGISESLALRIPRDRLSHFKPWILEIMRESNVQKEERGRWIPGWILRYVYRQLIPGTIKEFRKAMVKRESQNGNR